MKVKIKKLHENSVIPSYSKNGDAGMDLTAVSKHQDEYGNIVYGTGLAFEIPIGYVGLLFPRSSNAKKDLILSNSVGVLDTGYRGEVLFKYKNQINTSKTCLNTIIATSLIYDIKPFHKELAVNEQDVEHFSEYETGDRIGQIIILPYPMIEFEETDELSETERGIGGYGHTGK